MATADFNRDGKPDVAATISGPCTPTFCSTTVNVFAGSGKGWFLPSKNYIVGTVASNMIAAGDVNGDGITDIVAIGSSPNTGAPDTGVLLGKADGTFAAGKTYTLGVPELTSSSAT